MAKDVGQVVDCYRLPWGFGRLIRGGNNGCTEGCVDGDLVDVPGHVVDDVPGADATDVVVDGGPS